MPSHLEQQTIDQTGLEVRSLERALEVAKNSNCHGSSQKHDNHRCK